MVAGIGTVEFLSSKVDYEFPNGYNDDFGVDRFKISEALFDPSGIRHVVCDNEFCKNVTSPGAQILVP